MSGNKRRSKRNRNKARVRPEPENFWREDETFTEPEPIRPVTDPTATLRSIGAPGVPHGEDAETEFLKTTLRASSLVMALARSVDLTDDESEPEA